MSADDSKKVITEDLVKIGTSTLKHVEPPAEKIVLPTAEDIESEKQHITFVNGVESFDKNKLKPTVTKEKFILPDQEGFFLNKNLNF